MLQKTLTAIVGLVALVTATVVAIVAVAFALFAVLVPVVTPAGAAAVVAGVFALAVAAVALVVASGSNGHDKDHHGGSADFGLVERLFDMARQRPLLSVGAAIAAGIIAIRNPALVATIAAAFIDRPKPKK